jgi:F0F1-type ATP synthase assembly protein I
MINNWKGVGSFGTVGLEIVVGIVLGLLGGRWLDGKFHTAPYLTVVGFCLGLVTAGKAVFRSWKDMQRETEREEREQGNPEPMYGPESPRPDRRSPLPSPVPPPPENSDEQR